MGILGSLRRWRALGCALVLIVAVAWIDTRLKASPLDGYCPDDVRCVVAGEDFPAFYGGLQRIDAAKGVADELRRPLAAAELAVRKATGIRPTPRRWRAWLGGLFLAGWRGSDSGVCVRPGVLMRVADLLLRNPVEDGVRVFGADYFYGWRDGFLIVSASRAYVADALKASVRVVEPSEARDDLRFQWERPPSGVFHVLARDGLPVSGWIAGNASHRTTPLTAAAAWPETPMLAVTSSKWADVWTLWTGWTKWTELLQEWAGGFCAPWNSASLPDGWDASVDECAFAVLDLDTQETVPVPEVAMILRAKAPAQVRHPLEPLFAPDSLMPYEWNGQPGFMAAGIGEKLVPCLCRVGSDWMFASREPLMAQLAGHLRPAEPLDADIAIRLDWAKLAKCGEVMLRKAAVLELVPRMNVKDVDAVLMPYVRAAGQLGSLEFDAHAQGGRIGFDGRLAQQTKK